MIVLDGIGPLPAFSSVIIKANNILNTSGKPLQGLTSAIYYEPDLRPVVSGITAKVNNEDGVLEATSSKSGSIYLVKFDESNYNLDDYQSKNDLDQAVADNLGRKADAPYANTPVSISTNGLPGGYYLYYAVDQEGRLSEPADEWPQIEQTGPLLGLEDAFMHPGFSVRASTGTIFIEPQNDLTTYTFRLFDMTGRLIRSGNKLTGSQQLKVQDDHGILIVQLISADGLSIGIHKLPGSLLR